LCRQHLIDYFQKRFFFVWQKPILKSCIGLNNFPKEHFLNAEIIVSVVEIVGNFIR
jgi:hypothetical protein